MSDKDNNEFIRKYIEQVINRQDLSDIEEYIGGAFYERGTEHLEQFFSAFPDMQAKILDVFGDGEKVVARLEVEGTNSGPFAGQPPTGRKVRFQSFRIYRIVEGKIVDSWAMQDRLGMLEQLGFLSSSGDKVNWGTSE